MALLFILFPLLGLLIINLPISWLYKKVAYPMGIALTILQMVLVLTCKWSGWAELGAFVYKYVPIHFDLYFYALVALFTIGLIGSATLFVARGMKKADIQIFTNLLLIITMSMNGVVLAGDLFSLYMFLEITSVTSFILIAVYKGRKALTGSYKYFVMSAIATVFMLLSIAIIYMMVGDLSYGGVSQYVLSMDNTKHFQYLAAALLFISGLAIKAGLVPFHGWLPDAYSNAPASVSVLLAGIVTKISGVYALFIVYSTLSADSMLGRILMALGLVSILVGAITAIGQKDFKRMLAFSSISQVGYIIFGIGVGTEMAIFGAFVHFFNHATFKSLLFTNAAAIRKQTGTTDMDELGGLAGKMRVTGGTSVVGFLSAAGIPPLAGFWSKLIIIVAAWQAGMYIPAVIALLASVLTIAYFLRMQHKVFFGHIRESLAGIKEAGWSFQLVSLVLASIIVLLGALFPWVFMYLSAHGLI